MAHVSSGQRVSAGARFLDRMVPNWHKRICLETLDQASCKLDILGQLYGNFWVGICRLKIRSDGHEQMGFHPISHSTHPGRDQEVLNLTNAWKQEIVSRRTNPQSATQRLTVGQLQGNGQNFRQGERRALAGDISTKPTTMVDPRNS